MPTHLIVPLHLDALKVDQQLSIANTANNFSHLPWSGSTAYNDQPYLSETIASKPSDQNNVLQAGLHFHWALPDALTKSMSIPAVYKTAFLNVFGTTLGESIWQQLLQIKWLQPLPDNQSVVLGGDQPSSLADLPDVIKQNYKTIKDLINQSNFPAVPNRWVISRFENGVNKGSTLIESDYLWPEGQENDEAGQSLSQFYTAFPFVTDNPDKQPYRFMGRASSINSSPAKDDNYLPFPLTAVGYGEPSFAAFYPDSRSVFGYCDTQAGAPAAGVTYEITGWYNNSDNDYLNIFIQSFIINWKKAHNTQNTVGTHATHQQVNYLYLDLINELKKEFNWYFPVQVDKNAMQGITTQDGQQNAWDQLIKYKWIDNNGLLQPKAYDPKSLLGTSFHDQEDKIFSNLNNTIQSQLPEQTLFYTKYTYDTTPTDTPDTQADKIQISIGNTPTEALSALIGTNISPNIKASIEDHLEALQLKTQLQHLQLNIGPRFEALRHEKQFTAESGGTLWTIRAQSATNKKADQLSGSEQITLPEDIGFPLNTLNKTQQQLDHIGNQINALREQIYADWCWFLKKESSYLQSQNLDPVVKDPNDPGGGPINLNDPSSMGGSLMGGPTDPNDPSSMGGGMMGGPTDPNDPSSMGGGMMGDPTNPNDPSPPIDPSKNNSGKVDEKATLDTLKDFITWEIDNQLKALLEKETALQKELTTNHQLVKSKLIEFQQEAQYLNQNDINNWKSFLTILKSLGSKIDPNINAITANPGINFKSLLIQILNNWIDGASNKLGFPDGKATEEGTNLLNQKNAGTIAPGGLQRLNRLILEANFSEIKHQPKYQLEKTAAPRYWRPNDPAVFISGFNPSSRYGHPDNSRTDGLKNCKTLTLNTDLNTLSTSNLANLRSTIQQTNISINDNKGPGRWHPLFLNWNMTFDQATQKKSDTYSTDYISGYYKLGEAGFIPNNVTYSANAGLDFYGRSILTPSGNRVLKKTLAIELLPFLMEQFYSDEKIDPQNPSPTLAQFSSWIQSIDSSITSGLPESAPDRSPNDQIERWLQEELTQLNQEDSKIINWFLKKIQSSPNEYILNQFFTEKQLSPDITSAQNFEAFVKWASDRINLKIRYFNNNVTDKSDPIDIYLKESDANLSAFLKWLKPMLGDSWTRFCKDQNIPSNKQETFLRENYNAVISWFQPQVRSVLNKVIYVQSYRELLNIRGLSQAMSGFDQAMIMRHQTLQVNVADPAKGSDKSFTDKVKKAVQNANKVAPAEYLPFSPIRAGKMGIRQLSIVDNFGRFWPSKDEKPFDQNTSIISPGQMEIQGDDKSVILLPRFAQASRLNFRWLDANKQISEMNDHPATNPVCGWVLPNNLDGSLMIYGPSGEALGYIDQVSRWRVFPGNSGPVIPADIDNLHLAKMVSWICAQPEGFVSGFISTLDVAQENMEPENFAQHESLALLMGQPLALVRTSVQLELKVPLAINVSQDSIGKDIAHFGDIKKGGDLNSITDIKRQTFGFETVEVPLRIGEYRQLSDGLAGYWLEENNGYKANQFYAPLTIPITGLPSNIITRHNSGDMDSEETQFLIPLTLNDKKPHFLSMLIDPRSKIHANCGLLPIKEIHIPPDQYRKALQNIQIAFLSTPILTPQSGIHLSVPNEPGFQWSWVEIDGQQWNETTTTGILNKHQLDEHFDAQANAVWVMLLQQGWINKIDENRAFVVATDKRTEPDLSNAFKGFEQQIELLLDSTKINPMDSTARFSGKQEIKEGWLKLSPSEFDQD